MALDPASMAALSAMVSGGNAKAASDNVNEVKAATKGLVKEPASLKIENPYATKAVDQSGQKVESEQGSNPFITPDPLKKYMDEEEEAPAKEEQASEESQEEGEENTASANVEAVWVKGADGKRQKVEINYENKDAIKKAFISAAGRNKAFVERDRVIQELKQYKESVEEDLQVSRVLQEAYEKQGIDGILSLIGGPDAQEKYLQQKLQEKRIWEEATPAERRAMEAQKMAEQESKVKSEVEKRLAEMEKKLKEKDVEYTEKELQGHFNSSYDKYSFDGALGDDVQEAELNEMLWLRVQRNLEQVPEDQEITKVMVEKEFKKVSEGLRKLVKVQGKKQATKIVEKQKKKAAESIQNKAKSGMASQTEASQARKDFMSQLTGGSLVAAMTTWANNKGGFRK